MKFSLGKISRLWKKRSLIYKLSISVAVVFMLLEVVLFWFLVRARNTALSEGLYDKTLFVAQMLNTSLALPLQMHKMNVTEKTVLNDLLAPIHNDKTLLSVWVEDTDGHYVVGDVPLKKELSQVNFEKLKVNKKRDFKNIKSLKTKEKLYIESTIKIDNTKIGTLYFTYSLASFNKAKKEGTQKALLFAFCVFVVGILGFVLVLSTIISPIQSMTSAFKKMTEGELSQDFLEIRSEDELGMMIRAYNELLDRLKSLSKHARLIAEGDLTQSIDDKTKGDLANGFRAMTTTFTEIAKRFNELTEAINDRVADIFATSKQQEAGAAEQAATVSEVTATMGELAATARQIASNAENVTVSAEQTTDTVANGRVQLANLIDSITNIQQGSKTINDNIVQLNRRVQQIGGIVEIIDNIADRSDLLALNAALEGTKAGEAGKGFLLVSEEMRRMSENIFNSTADIKQLITEVTDATNATVMATEGGMKATRQGVERAKEAEKAFAQIVETIKETTMASHQISAATQQQHAGTDQIVSAMGEVSEVARQSLEGIRQTTKAMKDISDIASNLRKVIANYKISED